MPPTNEAFKKAFLQWEANVADLWSALLRDPAFLRQMWQHTEQQFEQQRRLTELLQAQPARLQLPTAAEAEALAAGIAAARAQVADLNQRLDALATLLREERS